MTRHLMVLLASLAMAACQPGEEAPEEGAFGPEDNDVTLVADGKADSASSGYRSGCNGPIRTGTYALRGDIISPTGVKRRAYVIIDGEKIAEVRSYQKGAPTGMPIIDTYGVIAPGLIDGHNHVEYNHIPIADFGKRYTNRDQWPNAALYKTLVKDPKNAVAAAGLTCQGLKHGEARAIVGGTTAIQGTPQLNCVRPLARNLEQTNFCKDRVRQNVTGAVGFDRSISGKPSFADSITADIAANRLDAFVTHIGEGIDEHARSEWDLMKGFGLNVPELVMIHAAAFTRTEFEETAAAGASVVWSPLSNLLLYGATADIPTALDAGVLVSLGADWAPSGSANLLGELKVADRVNKALWGGKITDEQLVQMATINGAIAYGLGKELGSIEAGKYADLLVVRKRSYISGYRTLIDSRPEDVLLVTVAGEALFGTQELMDAMGKQGDYEVVDACGQPRALDVTVVASDVTGAGESLASIESKLKAVNPKLTPIVDCTFDEMVAAFKGTPIEGKYTMP
jgi:cytosine/adenosine deaminase-related metal-dependent hydrolase